MKRIYQFGNGVAEGSKEQKNLLGGKGANLAEMTAIGLPVPPGFTITTDTCNEYYELGKNLPEELMEGIKKAINDLEDLLGKSFGGENPLLVSVRSGAAISMPGMMDTVLNLGLNDETVQYLAEKTNNEWFAYDSYRRFLQMFGNVALGIHGDKFEEQLESMKESAGVETDQELKIIELKKLVDRYKGVIVASTGEEFPQNPMDQLKKATEAVFASWNNERAIYYRNLNSIPHTIGTAVNIQSMVYGNMGETSGTGVAFTRQPATGEKILFGEYLKNAQGEDVVAGIRTPLPISASQGEGSSMEDDWSEMYQELTKLSAILESHYKDMQDIEFTIEEGKFFLLQTRTGKRSGTAMVKIALDFYNEGSITKEDVVMRIEPEKINELLHPTIAPHETPVVLAKGLAASPGVASGKIVFSAYEADKYSANGDPVILFRIETSPEDIHGMNISEGIVTARGGMTSHAAVVARGMGTPCVAGCSALKINYKSDSCKIITDQGEKTFEQGDWISIDGSTGNILQGKVETVPGNISANFETILKWSDEIRSLGIRANADNPEDAKRSIEFGAEGIGLCRTEHMFFEEDRINIMREMILASDEKGRRKALQNLLPFQREDFVGIYKAMKEKPVTIRFIDPPLHEFLPERKSDIEVVAHEIGCTYNDIKQKIKELHESNPMLGLRGCRLGILYPEVIEMQAKAVFEAAFTVKKEGINVIPEIMIPLVSNATELSHQRAIVEKTYKKIQMDKEINPQRLKLDYLIGTMIELPRAALTADDIAQHADFFSFGTNDLTQTTYGLSRDDAGKFLPLYKDQGFITHDPFVVLDQNGVGQLVQMATEKGRAAKEGIKIGICGEHGGEPQSIDFCHRIGLDYVSCSPFRVPVARVAAAQAHLKNKK